jgi:hypothetical protein
VGDYMHIAALGPVLIMPVGQGMHPRFVVSVGGAETNSLSTQFVHGVQAEALVVVLNPVSQ